MAPKTNANKGPHIFHLFSYMYSIYNDTYAYKGVTLRFPPKTNIHLTMSHYKKYASQCVCHTQCVCVCVFVFVCVHMRAHACVCVCVCCMGGVHLRYGQSPLDLVCYF